MTEIFCTVKTVSKFDEFNPNINLPLSNAREMFERFYVENVLKLYDNNVSRAAEHAGFERSAFHRKMRQLAIKVER